MRQFVIEFDDDEIEELEGQLEKAQDAGVLDTLEEYIHYAAMSHCRTMKAASQMMAQAGGMGGLEGLLGQENVHVGVINMPVHLDDLGDKDEFSEYLSDVLNDAVKNFNNRNNGQLN